VEALHGPSAASRASGGGALSTAPHVSGVEAQAQALQRWRQRRDGEGTLHAASKGSLRPSLGYREAAAAGAEELELRSLQLDAALSVAQAAYGPAAPRWLRLSAAAASRELSPPRPRGTASVDRDHRLKAMDERNAAPRRATSTGGSSVPGHAAAPGSATQLSKPSPRANV
jgi:hypothetical protein